MSEATTGEFEAATSRYRRELFAHCYRMTGSVQDAEDIVQDTYLRAWQAFGRFERRSSARTWLYRIATNTSLTALQRRSRRPLPSGLGPPSPDPLSPPLPEPAGVRWLEPVPDHLVIDETGDPADIAAARQSVRLALVAAFQILPPRQRAALLLCDVLSLPPADAAQVLDVSVAALKSLLSAPAPGLPRGRSAMRTWPSRQPRARAACSTSTWPPSSDRTWPLSNACSPKTPRLK